MRKATPLGTAAFVRVARYACMSVVVAGFVSGCGGREHASPYAAAVFDDPPIYCYRTIGDADCYRQPLVGAERRLVNYYGPPPEDYDRPEPLPAPQLHPPPPRRPVPDPNVVVPAPASAVTPANQPTPLFPTTPSPAAEAEGGNDLATTTTPGTTTATATVAVTPTATPPVAAQRAAVPSPGNPANVSPKPRPGTAPGAWTPQVNAPLVIEVADR